MGRKKLPVGNAGNGSVGVFLASQAMLEGDVMCCAEVSQYPDLKSESPRNQAIMCALACGYSTNFVGKMFGVSQSVIWKISHRIDPKGMYRATPAAKKAFICKLAETRCMEALSSITPEKLDASTARELSGIAKDLKSVGEKLVHGRHGTGVKGRLEGLLAMLEADRVVDGEFEEVSVDGCGVVEGGEGCLGDTDG